MKLGTACVAGLEPSGDDPGEGATSVSVEATCVKSSQREGEAWNHMVGQSSWGEAADVPGKLAATGDCTGDPNNVEMWVSQDSCQGQQPLYMESAWS